MKFQHTSGGFTLPGEAGQEKLTLELAEKWGADVIRDSDGTQLSEEILDTGYDIYSTICIIRDHNAWAKQHPDCLQQTFLSTDPVIATEGPLTVAPMAGFFAEQFAVNDCAIGRSGTARRINHCPPEHGRGMPRPARLRWRSRCPSTPTRSVFWHGGSGKKSICTTT